MKIILSILIWLSFPILILAQSPPNVSTVVLSEPAPGFIFLTPANPHSIGIMSNSGVFVFWQDLNTSQATDFKPHENGMLSYFDGNDNAHHILNNQYEEVDTVQAVNGYDSDLHEFIIDDNGHYLFLIYAQIPYDLSPYGGYVTATLQTTIIQELNENKDLVFEWNILDHIPVTDSNQPLDMPLVDYPHGNAIEIDNDGNLLLSSRHLDEVTKIDRTTGAIIWRLGGKANQFSFMNDSGFAMQHDVRRLDNGNLTLFDNGTEARNYSRAVEYEIDEVNKTARLVWQVTGPWARCCGNVQRLPNGNTLVNWGNTGYITEIDATTNDVIWEAQFSQGFTYRAFRFPWMVRHWLPVMFKQ